MKKMILITKIKMKMNLMNNRKLTNMKIIIINNN
jgi:hypothetical protein